MSAFAQALEALFAGAATPEQEAELSAQLAADPALRSEYVAQMKVHALLTWRAGRLATPAQVLPFPPRRHPALRPLALAALLAALAAVAAVLLPRVRHHAAPPVAAPPGEPFEVLLSSAAVLEGEPAPWRSGELHRARALHLLSGLLRVRLSSGAVLGAEGPCRLELLDPLHARLVSGRATAEASHAHGFTIETAATRVVDFGTRFGVQAEATGSAVVVFEGAVELQGRTRPLLLAQGEAVHVDAAGPFERLPNVSSGAEPEQWRAAGGGLFRLVTDNRRAPDDPKFYEIVPGGLVEDTRAYVDREHEWNGLVYAGMPGFLRGADLIRTFNDDKRATDLEITLHLVRPATVYLFLDQRSVPAWVARTGFHDTGEEIGLDEGPSASRLLTTSKGAGISIDRIFSVWALEVRGPLTLTLGPPREGPTGAKAMYGIAAQPLGAP